MMPPGGDHVPSGRRWVRNADGTLSARIGVFDLVVMPNMLAGEARFQLFRRAWDRDHPALVASGHRRAVRDAMQAAERSAWQMI